MKLVWSPGSPRPPPPSAGSTAQSPTCWRRGRTGLPGPPSLSPETPSYCVTRLASVSLSVNGLVRAVVGLGAGRWSGLPGVEAVTRGFSVDTSYPSLNVSVHWNRHHERGRASVVAASLGELRPGLLQAVASGTSVLRPSGNLRSRLQVQVSFKQRLWVLNSWCVPPHPAPPCPTSAPLRALSTKAAVLLTP